MEQISDSEEKDVETLDQVQLSGQTVVIDEAKKGTSTPKQVEHI